MAFLDAFKKEKKPKSPTKVGGETEGSISADIIPFLNIIAKNSLALPGMARDMNVLRQNIVKLVKLKNKEAITTKADKFFKTEDQKEAELEAARKKETAPKQEKSGRDKKQKEEKDKDDGGIFGDIFKALWSTIKFVLGSLFLGLAFAFAKAFDLGRIVANIAEKLNPMPLIEGLFSTLKEGWKKISETDIVKETLIKGFGKFLDFVTAGLFGENELRESLDSLTKYLTPMIDVLGETFDKVVGWLRDNVGWDPFTIPLSKATDFLPDWAKGKLTLPDVIVPGFRPFKNAGKKEDKPSGGGSQPKAPTEKETADTAPKIDTSKLAGGDKEKEKMLSGLFEGSMQAGKSGDASGMFESLSSFADKYKEKYPGEAGAVSTTSGVTTFPGVVTPEKIEPTPTPVSTSTSAPAPTPIPSAAPTAEELQDQIEGLKKRKEQMKGQHERQIRKYKDPSSKHYDPERAKEMEQDSKEALATYDNDIADAEKQLANIKKSGGKSSTPSSGGSAAPTMSASAGSSGGSSGGSLSGGGGSQSSGGGGSPSPAPAASSPTTSGASISSASSEVAEGQRMDSMANAGTFVDAGTVNNSSSTAGREPKKTASAYNDDFIQQYQAIS